MRVAAVIGGLPGGQRGVRKALLLLLTGAASPPGLTASSLLIPGVCFEPGLGAVLGEGLPGQLQGGEDAARDFCALAKEAPAAQPVRRGSEIGFHCSLGMGSGRGGIIGDLKLMYVK